MENLIKECVSATQKGELEVVTQYITQKGVSCDAVDSGGCSLLHWAAINQRYNLVLFLLNQGADVNIIGGDLMETPLLWAVRSQYLPTVDLLLRKGANIHHTSSEGGFDALHLACQNSNTAMVCALLINGADPNNRNTNGDTPLLAVYKQKNPNNDIVRLLLKFNACVFAMDNNHNNVLHLLLGAHEMDQPVSRNSLNVDWSACTMCMDKARATYGNYFGEYPIEAMPELEEDVSGATDKMSKFMSNTLTRFSIGRPGDIRLMFVQANKQGQSAFVVSYMQIKVG